MKTLKQNFIRITSVIIIRIDNRKGFLNQIPCHPYRVTRAPWFLPGLRNNKPAWNHIQFLKNITHFYFLFPLLTDSLTKIRLNIMTNNKNNFAEPGFQSVIDGIIQKCSVFRSNRSNLFQSTKSASHTGSHNEQDWFHYFSP